MPNETWDDSISESGTGPWVMGPITASFVYEYHSIILAAGEYVLHGSGANIGITYLVGDGATAPVQIGTSAMGGVPFISAGDSSTTLYFALFPYVTGATATVSAASMGGYYSIPANDTPAGVIDVNFSDGLLAIDNHGATGRIGPPYVAVSHMQVQDGFRSMYWKFTVPITGYYRFTYAGLGFYDIAVGNLRTTPIQMYYHDDDEWFGGGVLDAGIEYYLQITQYFPQDGSADGYLDGDIAWVMADSLPPNAWGYGGVSGDSRRIDITQRQSVSLDISAAIEDFENITFLYKLTATKTGVLSMTITPDDPDADWSVRVENMTSGGRGDFHSGSYDDVGGARFGQVAVVLGDVVYIDLFLSTNLIGGQFKWGVAGYTELTWSDWFNSDATYDHETEDPTIGRLWYRSGADYSSAGGAGWSIPYGPGFTWLTHGPFSDVGSALASLSADNVLPMGDPLSAGPGAGTQFGGGTWVLMGQGGGMDGNVHSEIWYNEQAIGAAPPNLSGVTLSDMPFTPAMAYRADNGIDTKYGSFSGTNPFKFNSGEKAYIQYGSDVGVINDQTAWRLKLYIRAQFSWANSLPLAGSAYVEMLWVDFSYDTGSGMGPDPSYYENWPATTGEQMLTFAMPPGSGTETSPSSWVEYPNGGELQARFEAIRTGTGNYVLISQLTDARDEYSNAHTWASVGGPPADYTGLYGASWDYSGSSNARGIMGVLYPPTYRWGYLVNPNYDIINPTGPINPGDGLCGFDTGFNPATPPIAFPPPPVTRLRFDSPPKQNEGYDRGRKRDPNWVN